jgi:hypothetical protein
MMDIYDVLRLEWVREILVAVVLVMLLIIVVLFAVLVMHKLYVERRARRNRRLREEFTAVMAQRLFDSKVRVEKPRKDYEYEAWGDVIAEMMVGFAGETAEHLREEARKLGLDSHFREMAHSRSWIKRFVAVEKLGILRFPEFREIYKSKLTSEKDPRILAKAVWALSMVADESVPATINGVLKNPLFMSSKFTEFIYTNIITSLQERGWGESFKLFLEGMKADPEIPLVLKRDIVAACGMAQFYPARENIRDYFYHYHDSPEMRMACIRALERLSDSDAQQIIGKGLADEDWRVRAVAAKSAYICGDAQLAALKDVLKDKNYYVRMNAALSLAKIGMHGVEALTEATLMDDRFAADVSRYVLKR